MKKQFDSLAIRFYVIITIIIVTALSVNAYIQYNNETRVIEKALHDRAQSLAELLAQISIEPLLTYDDVTLNDYAKFTSKQKDIVYAAVVNIDGQSLTHYLMEKNSCIGEILVRFEDPGIDKVIAELQRDQHILSLKTPVVFEDRLLAYASIGLDRTPYNQASRKTLIKIILVTLMVGIFVVGAIYYLFNTKIFRPIGLLTEGTRSIANFEFGKEIRISGKGEIAQLADSFDSMRLHLKETIASRDLVMNELSELNDSLEERVHERTQELQILNMKIAHQAMHDPLTDLPNRTLFIEQLQNEIRHAKRDDTRLAVFMMDLNNFKEVNDTLGHHVGDQLLIDVASRLSSAVRDSDTVGRLGGDEFAMVLPQMESEDHAIKLARKILDIMLPSFELSECTLKVGVSIGIALYPDHSQDHTSLMRLADVAMYEAKNNKTGHCVYHHDMDRYSPLRLSLMDYLHTAIENNQLQLHYQPQLSLDENRVTSVEALIRWYHPEIGWIFPDQFIPMAENSGLIHDLSNWVLNEAFRQWRQWQQSGLDLQIAINLSARDLMNPELPALLATLCEKYRMDPHGVKIEITEGAIMINPEQVIEIMQQPIMKDLIFSIDDFGTGYSSLSYLKRLSVSEVKIDKSFVMDMVHNQDDESIVRSVIDLVHNLGHVVVAEGVEDLETLERLRVLGCDKVQGYYFSKAVVADELQYVIGEIDRNLQVVHGVVVQSQNAR